MRKASVNDRSKALTPWSSQERPVAPSVVMRTQKSRRATVDDIVTRQKQREATNGRDAIRLQLFCGARLR